MNFEIWLAFVLGAVLSWGVYVPVLHEGQATMGGGAPSAGAIRAFLCVGLAYFVTAVVIPLIALQFGFAGGERLDFTTKDGAVNSRALTFSILGGIAGAAGALCIIFSIKNGGKPLYVAPLVFAGAPIVNAIVSIIWHPPEDGARPEYLPGWIMFAGGILLAAIGAGLVLYSKGMIDQKAREIRQAKAKMATAIALTQDPPPTATPSTGIKAGPETGVRDGGHS
ncbi:MAG: hypothetical protein HYX68_25980 [Planctomycetes bacterium]|nr:hypothetical protein [Planctomycetota bacterium]